MNLTIPDLFRGFREAGIETGDHLLVHSSLALTERANWL